MENFKSELEQLINKYSIENNTNTPDFILAEYLIDCLNNFDKLMLVREKWYGNDNYLRKIKIKKILKY